MLKFLRGLCVATAFLAGKRSAAQDDGIDAALGALRPGMPAEAVETAMGPLWRAPAPHKGGEIDILENSHGFTVRLDRNGVIGRLGFGWRFKGAVDGLRIGMSISEARKTAPDLSAFTASKVMGNEQSARRDLPGGARMILRFSSEKLNGISILTPDAEYDEPYAPDYPAPEGAPGAPFADANLKLVVLSALLWDKAIDLGTPEELASHALGRAFDLYEEGDDPVPEAMEYLARYPLTEDLLGEVRALTFDGGEEIYRYVWYFWSGETEMFDVSSLEGLARCRNLERIEVISMLERFDIAALRGLDKLEKVSISTEFENLGALRDLPGLKALRMVDNATYEQANTPGHPTRKLFDELRARGVALHVIPSAWRGPRPAPFE